MFDKEYAFHGKHADMVRRLTGELDSRHNRGIFATNYDVYLLAPMIGFLYGRKAPVDKGDTTTKIFGDKIMSGSAELKYNYRLLMLLIDKEKLTNDDRVSIAFRLDGDDEKRAPYDAVYQEYVRGGVEVLYEHIFQNASSTEEYIMNLYEFLREINCRYYEEMPESDLSE